MFLLGPVLTTLALAHLTAALALGRSQRQDQRPSWAFPLVVAGCAAAAVPGTLLLDGRPWWPSLAAGVLLAAGCVAGARRNPDLHPVGAAFWVTWLAFGAMAVLWAVLFLGSLELSTSSTLLLWLAAAIGLVTVPSAVITAREGWEPLLRRHWRRPRRAVDVPPARRPRVSVHVPVHAEPPEVVIGTLDRLAALDYPDFEVLVIDNNTADPRLWRPVEAHCRALGDRFRFLHVEGLAGAKAGALNWALPRTDPAAELVAVVDADYHVRPDWLRRTVGHFEDPRMGFVQSPHAYRDYEQSRFGRWASWEYAVFFATGMVSLNEHNAGLTVGTMSVIRRAALEEAGGWAEWCLTEDSELAIRIHAAGYDSVYLTERFGRGLIPETFAAYRKQRFRWTYGPVQEIRRHWRLFLPTWLGGTPSRLTPAQKRHHANHGLDVVGVGLRALTLPLVAALATSLVLHGERVPLPAELWVASTAVLLSSLMMRYHVFTRVVGATVRQAAGGVVAFAALSLVISLASLKASFGRPAVWQRTEKFLARRRGLQVLAEVRAETAAGAACVLAASVILALTPGGMLTLVALGLAVQGARLLAALCVAVVADRALGGRAPAAAGVSRAGWPGLRPAAAATGTPDRRTTVGAGSPA